MSNKRPYLLEKVVELISSSKKGKVLDLGCGNGRAGRELLDSGFDVEACDMDRGRFEFHNEIKFTEANLDNPLPYGDNSFDYVIFTEVIEHIYNPNFVISEISRVLRKDGMLVLSTPNILNIGSRFRFFIEGSFDFFREPTLDFSKCFPAAIQNMHVIPWRYQELEYLLARNNLETEKVFIDKRKSGFYPLYLLMLPILSLQAKAKARRVRRQGGVDFQRMNRILLSKDMLLGRHVIFGAVKKT